jgi:hypothetical protein
MRDADLGFQGCSSHTRECNENTSRLPRRNRPRSSYIGSGALPLAVHQTPTPAERHRQTWLRVFGLLSQIRDDEVHLVFDGVDEMARPYTAEGREETIDFLSEVGNRRAAIYLVRSAYFPKLTEMITAIGSLADHDFTTARKRTVLAKLVRLRQEQVNQFLDVRLGLEDAKARREEHFRRQANS